MAAVESVRMGRLITSISYVVPPLGIKLCRSEPVVVRDDGILSNEKCIFFGMREACADVKNTFKTVIYPKN